MVGGQLSAGVGERDPLALRVQPGHVGVVGRVGVSGLGIRKDSLGNRPSRVSSVVMTTEEPW